MARECEIKKEEFLELTADEIRRIVLQKSKPRTGIFIADGCRRLLMSRARLSPGSDEFYNEYARFFTDSLKNSLDIFFNHGLETLFFPLFGPSLLLRQNKFQSITIPAAYQKIFLSEEWLSFYKEKGIRVKAYGDLSQLDKIDVNHLSMAEGIKQTIEKTASYAKHTVFFGFMSENSPGLEMPQMIIDFYKSNDRPPTYRETVEKYYGEDVPDADFFIFSDKLSGHNALPPLICNRKTKMYYFPAPGFLAFNIENFRRILYDFLFIYSPHSISEYSDECLSDIESLDEFFRHHKNTIIGTGKIIGDIPVPDI